MSEEICNCPRIGKIAFKGIDGQFWIAEVVESFCGCHEFANARCATATEVVEYLGMSEKPSDHQCTSYSPGVTTNESSQTVRLEGDKPYEPKVFIAEAIEHKHPLGYPCNDECYTGDEAKGAE